MRFQAVKAVDVDKGLIEGLAIPYGGPVQGRDLYGDAFTKDTNLALDWYSERPLLYGHGMDGQLQLEPVGKQFDAQATEQGIWTQAQLDTSHRYWDNIKTLLDKGVLFFSSGSVGHLVQKADGIIKQWPWVELTLTPKPANPYSVIDASEVTKAYKSVGLERPDRFVLPSIGDTDGTTRLDMDAITALYAKAIQEETPPVEDDGMLDMYLKFMKVRAS